MRTIAGISLLLAAHLAGCGADSGGDEPPGTDSGAGGRTFYLRASGDDAASGLDPDHAWRSLARANREDFEPGDTLLFEGGATFAGTLRLDAADSGEPEAPLRVSSFGTGRARIDAGDGDGIAITDTEFTIVERLLLEGGWNADAQRGNDGEGVSATGTVSGERRRSLSLRELEVRGFKHAGIGLHARPSDDAKDSGYEGVVIRDCVVHDNADFGVVSDGPYIYDGPGYSHADVHVLRVRSHHNRGLRDKGEHTGSGIVLSDVDGARIEHSVAHHNGEWNDHESGGGFGIWAWDANRVVIQWSESYDNQTRTSDGGGFDLDGGVTHSVLQFNYSHGNAGAGFGAFQFAWARPFDGNLIQYNISQNDGFAFLVWDGNGDMGSLDVVHNVGYGPKPILSTYSALADTTFSNNIFYGTGPRLLDVFDGSHLVLQANAYYTSGPPLEIAWDTGTAQPTTFDDFEAYRAATEQEQRGLYADPGLVAPGEGPTLDDPERLSELDMYRLRDDSPLIDRGLDPAELEIETAARDFFGAPAPRGAAPDMGVHELR